MCECVSRYLKFITCFWWARALLYLGLTGGAYAIYAVTVRAMRRVDAAALLEAAVLGIIFQILCCSFMQPIFFYAADFAISTAQYRCWIEFMMTWIHDTSAAPFPTHTMIFRARSAFACRHPVASPATLSCSNRRT